MTLPGMIEHARTRFPHNGRFSLLPGELIKEVVKREQVPEARGVYLIFRSDELNRPLYIGKAGTLETNGSRKEQGLRKRLMIKQKGVYRNQFFRSLIAEKELSGLTFFWFVRHDQDNKIIPALLEMEFLQAHYDQYGCLPELNECA